MSRGTALQSGATNKEKMGTGALKAVLGDWSST